MYWNICIDYVSGFTLICHLFRSANASAWCRPWWKLLFFLFHLVDDNFNWCVTRPKPLWCFRYFTKKDNCVDCQSLKPCISFGSPTPGSNSVNKRIRCISMCSYNGHETEVMSYLPWASASHHTQINWHSLCSHAVQPKPYSSHLCWNLYL